MIYYSLSNKQPAGSGVGQSGRFSIVSIFEFSIWESQIRTNQLWMFFDTMSDFNVPGSRTKQNTMNFRKSTVSGGPEPSGTTKLPAPRPDDAAL